MKTLELKQQELDNRENSLMAEEQRIQALKQEIVAKIDMLRALEERLGAVIEVDKSSEGKKYKDLAKVYDSAPPDKVGPMLEKMDTKTAAGITMNMKRDRAGAVLGYLSPEKAIEITREITRASGKAQPQQ
jgi:flagellar motility protein MotE (MotC chaperone)